MYSHVVTTEISLIELDQEDILSKACFLQLQPYFQQLQVYAFESTFTP